MGIGVATNLSKPIATEAIILYTVIAIVGVMMILMIFCCCCGKRCRPKNFDDEFERREVSMGANLLPPVFYTEDIEDPLLQPDLKDHLKT